MYHATYAKFQTTSTHQAPLSSVVASSTISPAKLGLSGSDISIICKLSPRYEVTYAKFQTTFTLIAPFKREESLRFHLSTGTAGFEISRI